jgi:N-acyl-D-amino-acid deacylase
MPFDVVIRGGTVLSGTGAGGLRADVGIRGDRIEALEPNLGTEAGRIIDATGLTVAPGFIDIHAHGDLYALLCPEAPARLHDGVTTEVVGNCGESPFPQTEAMLAERRGGEETHGIVVDWETLDDYARRHDEARCGINRASLVGHGKIREAVMGEEDRAPTPEDLDAMRREVGKALDAGASGFSTGLIYTPGMFAQPAEIEALCEVAARRGALYASHIRGEGDSVEAALEEFANVGRRTGVRLQLSHVKVSGSANWGKADRVIARLHELRAEGLDLACDRYPYTAAATSLSSQLPRWSREGSRLRMLERMAETDARRRILRELERSNPTPQDWQAIVVSDAACDVWRTAEGRSILDLANQTGREPAEMLLVLLAAGEGRTSIVVFSMCEDNLLKWLRLPFVAIGSDSTSRSVEGPTAKGKPHPRSYGTFARVLGRYVREKQVLSLPEAVRRMTSLPASRLGLKDRGVLRPGAFADVTIFDPQTIADRATYELPHQYSAGVRCVLVNGAVALAEGELTGVRSGRFLRRDS